MPKLYNAKGEIINTELTATAEVPGLLCCHDKAKIDTIEEGANKTVVDTTLNATSTNPVQNKVIYEALMIDYSEIEFDTGLPQDGNEISY